MLRALLLLYLLSLSISSTCQRSNPFDITRSKSKTEQIDTTQTSSESEIPTKIEGDNPFDISHIPIRKNQYQEIEKLSFKQEKKASETIALNYGPLWLIILSLCIIAFIVIRKKDHYYTLLRSLVNDNFMRLSNHEQNGGQSLVYILGYLLFLINASLLIDLILKKIFNVFLGNQYLIVGIFLVLFFVGKHVINYIFSHIYDFAKESQLYDFTIISIYNLLSIVFVSMNILIVFGPDAWIRPLAVAGLAFFILFLFIRYYHTCPK